MIYPDFVAKDDLVGFVSASFNGGCQSSVAVSKLNNLFSTVRDKIGLVHADARRSIEEYIGPDFSINQFTVHSSNIPLGNHYHKKASGDILLAGAPAPGVSEMFLFDEGGGELLTQNISLDGQSSLSVVERYKIMVNDLIILSPYQAHTFFLIPGTKFRGFRTVPFDENDMDLNPWKLELPK